MVSGRGCPFRSGVRVIGGGGGGSLTSIVLDGSPQREFFEWESLGICGLIKSPFLGEKAGKASLLSQKWGFYFLASPLLALQGVENGISFGQSLSPRRREGYENAFAFVDGKCLVGDRGFCGLTGSGLATFQNR